MIKYLHIAVFTMVVILFCGGYFIYSKMKSSNITPQTLEDVDVYHQYPELPEIFSNIEPTETNRQGYAKADILIEYQESYDKNNDLAGWIEIDGVMSLPVMHTPHEPEYYLTHYFDKTEKKHGTPFIDARCSFNPKSDNIIVHGHNMNDKTMFSPLMKYKSEDYYRNNPSIQFNTLYEKSEYEIYAAFISTHDTTDVSQDNYFNLVNFRSVSVFNSFVKQVSEVALYKTGITPEYGDTFITLMTCTNRNEEDRMNVIAMKKRS